MSQLLFTQIASVRRKQALVSAGRGLAAMAGLAVLLLAGTMLLDWYVELPWRVRAALLALDIAALAYILFTSVLAPLVFGPDREEAALMVERAMPQFRTRLIASVQLSHPQAVPAGASRSIVSAMIRQTEALAEPLDFASVIRTEPLLKIGALAALVILLGASAYVWAGDVSADLLKRALFLSNIEVPRKTGVTCVSENQIVAVGDNVTLQARASRVIPTDGTVHLRFASGRKQTFTIDPIKDDTSLFACTIENVQETFTYYIRLNDGRSNEFTVTAVPRPTVMESAFTQEYPAYARRSPERRLPGDLSLLAGSKLQIKIKASKPIKVGAIHLVGVDTDVPMTIAGDNRDELSGDITIPPANLTGFSLRLVDDFGIASRAETVYPVDVVLDKEPTVKIIWPDRKEELATQQARLLMSFEAADYYGVAKVFLRYRVDRQLTPETVLPGEEKAIELDLSSASPEELRLVRRRYEFDLAGLQPKVIEGGMVEYWLEVQDGNTVTGPGKATSDRYTAKVVSDVAKRDELMHRLSDQLGTIDYVTQDQEKLNQNLGALILEKK